jgi:isopenicillin N synthase-like dioxygenase
MMAQVPRIDISPFLSEDPGASDAVAGAVAKACEEIGFFKISHHGVALDLVAQAFATASEFFDLPQEIKDGSRPPRSAPRTLPRRLGTTTRRICASSFTSVRSRAGRGSSRTFPVRPSFTRRTSGRRRPRATRRSFPITTASSSD